VALRSGAATRVAVAPASGTDYLEIIELVKDNTWGDEQWVKDGNYVLMFEDSREGDFDYNDLVLYVRHSISDNGALGTGKITLSVNPSLWAASTGSPWAGKTTPASTCSPRTYTATINGLGCTVYRDRRTMTNYATKDTYPIVFGYYKFDPMPTTCSSASNDTKQIKWFIKTSGSKYYVASIARAAPEGTFPYGLCIPNNAYHPSETVNIWEACPDFESWVRTDAPLSWSNNRVKANCYEKHVNYAHWWKQHKNGGASVDAPLFYPRRARARSIFCPKGVIFAGSPFAATIKKRIFVKIFKNSEITH
jgi:hypothetical protein